MSLAAVVNQVDSGINLRVLDPRVLRNVLPPPGGIIADEVVAFAGKLFGARDGGVLIRTRQRHANHGSLPRLGLAGHWCLQRQHGFLLGQEKSITAAAGDESHFGVGLSLVRFEHQWKVAVADLLLAATEG